MCFDMINCFSFVNLPTKCLNCKEEYKLLKKTFVNSSTLTKSSEDPSPTQKNDEKDVRNWRRRRGRHLATDEESF